MLFTTQRKEGHGAINDVQHGRQEEHMEADIQKDVANKKGSRYG